MDRFYIVYHPEKYTSKNQEQGNRETSRKILGSKET